MPRRRPTHLTDQSFAQSLDRMVIRTAQLSVEVPDMEPALAQARQIASRGGGFVSASNTHLEKVNDQDRMVADLTASGSQRLRRRRPCPTCALSAK